MSLIIHVEADDYIANPLYYLKLSSSSVTIKVMRDNKVIIRMGCFQDPEVSYKTEEQLNRQDEIENIISETLRKYSKAFKALAES